MSSLSAFQLTRRQTMSNPTANPDHFLPIFPYLPPTKSISSNLSSPFQSLPWNATSKASIIVYHHPILYGIALYALLLIVVGTIGNLLTLVILLRPNLRKHTTMRYLIAVALADLASLYSWNLNLFYKHMINPYQNDLEDASIFACRLISFLGFVTLQLSSWYLTLVSLDRCLNIHLLFWHRQIGRANRCVYIILTVTAVIVLLNSHLLFYNGYRQPNCVPFKKRTCLICYARARDPFYIFPKWEKIHVMIYNLIPFSVMLTSNCFIIRRSVPSNLPRMSTVDLRKTGNYRQRKQRQLTYLLLCVTFLFVILTTPVMIYNVFLRNSLVRKKPLKYILQGILLCMQFTSHAINFFVYCHGASNFRHELDAFLVGCRVKKDRRLERNTVSIRYSKTRT